MSHVLSKPDTVSSKTVHSIGIAGGGQLAQMMIDSIAHLGLDIIVLDPDPHCSASSQSETLIVANFDSVNGVRKLGHKADVVTFEIERISVEALASLERDNIPVRPSASVLKIIQDKLLQKEFLVANNIPTSDFFTIQTAQDLADSLPRVWKARRDGYDGRGVKVLRDRNDLADLPNVPALAETLVDIDYELAMMIARDINGNTKPYPLTEIEMDPEKHVMQRVIAPADVTDDIEQQCATLAETVVNKLDYVGVLALEFFVSKNGVVLVNELSPRPHNSGHYTIESCRTSQFEQHMLAVAGMQLGDTSLTSAAVTFNVLGDPDALGTPRYVGFDLEQANVFIHNYNKPQVRPGRKMGHVTVLGADREQAIALANQVQPQIRVESSDDQ